MLVDLPVPLSPYNSTLLALRPRQTPRVFHEQVLLHLIADQIIQHDRVHIANWDQTQFSFGVTVKAEGAVHRKAADAIALIEVAQHIVHFVFIACLLQRMTDVQHDASPSDDRTYARSFRSPGND